MRKISEQSKPCEIFKNSIEFSRDEVLTGCGCQGEIKCQYKERKKFTTLKVCNTAHKDTRTRKVYFGTNT